MELKSLPHSILPGNRTSCSDPSSLSLTIAVLQICLPCTTDTEVDAEMMMAVVAIHSLLCTISPAFPWRFFLSTGAPFNLPSCSLSAHNITCFCW